LALLCKRIVEKSKEVKTGWSNSWQTSLAESAKEGCGSERAVLPVKMNIG
jgi:hypothetical protein